MGPETNGNGKDSWTEWRQHVLITMKSLDIEMKQVRMDIATLKVKAGMWGLVAGAIPVVIGLAIVFIKSALTVT